MAWGKRTGPPTARPVRQLDRKLHLSPAAASQLFGQSDSRRTVITISAVFGRGPLSTRVLSESEIERMSTTCRRFCPEFKDELCCEVIDTSKPIKDVAEVYSVGAETLRRWLIKYRDAHGGTEGELSLPERSWLKELEREN